MLEIDALSKGYETPAGRLAVLDRVSLRVAKGERVALMGESGSGKSTLLHLVAGLDAADAGTVRIGPAAMSALDDAGRAALRRREVGIVFQQFNLIPSLTVLENLAFQARLADRLDELWLDQLADRLGLSGLLDRYPEQLSGGQQQRVAIGRALAGRPALALADEPTGALDEATADAVAALMRDLAASAGCAFLMATHSPRLAAMMDRTVRLHAGRIVAPATGAERAA
jgi:putative ABC transport system ATP-binding protein